MSEKLDDELIDQVRMTNEILLQCIALDQRWIETHGRNYGSTHVEGVKMDRDMLIADALSRDLGGV